VADLTPEVMNALVRLMNGDTDYRSMSTDDLFRVATFAKDGRATLHEVVLVLREKGFTFAQIGERLGVTESAASRWVTPPRPPGRRPRAEEDDEA
jgi:hypothetical protein